MYKANQSTSVTNKRQTGASDYSLTVCASQCISTIFLNLLDDLKR